MGLAVIALLIVPQARAAEFLAPNQDDHGVVNVTATESHKNLYVAGGDVTVSSATSGDLYVAGGNATINGSVEQDVAAAGGTVVIDGSVGGDVRVLGGKVTINSAVKGDVLIGGGTIMITDKASVGGDFVVSGGTVDLNGPVSGSARIAGGSATINSKIAGAVMIKLSEKLVLGSQADIASPIAYTGNQPAVVSGGAKVAQINFTKAESKKKGFLGFLGALAGIKLLAMIFAALLLVYVLPKRSASITESMLRRPWANLGIGFLTLIVIPVILIVLTLVLVGYYVAIMALLVYLLCLALAALFGGIFIGAWLIKLLTKKSGLALDWQAVLVGMVIMILLGFVPFVGWLIDFILLLMAFGALVGFTWKEIRSDRASLSAKPV